MRCVRQDPDRFIDNRGCRRNVLVIAFDRFANEWSDNGRHWCQEPFRMGIPFQNFH